MGTTIRSVSTTSFTRTTTQATSAEWRGGDRDFRRDDRSWGRDRDDRGWGRDAWRPQPYYPVPVPMPVPVPVEPVYPQPCYPTNVYPQPYQPYQPYCPAPIIEPVYPTPYYTGPAQAIGNLVGGLVDIFGR